MTKKRIDPDYSPQARNIRFSIWLEKQNLKAFRIVTNKISQKIIQTLFKEKLLKSDLPRGWTGLVPTIEIDVIESITPVLDRYLSALQWLSIGKYAGKGPSEVSKEIGLHKEFTPGSVISSYLHAIDTEREYYKLVFGSEAPLFSEKLMAASVKNLVGIASPGVDYMIAQVKNSILQSVIQIVNTHNQKTTSLMLDSAGDLDKPSKTSLSKIADKAQSYIDKSNIQKELRTAFKTQEKSTILGIQDNVARGGSTGREQALHEFYGDRSMKVILITKEDPKVCSFCAGLSKNPDGTYKVYKLSDFKPYGHNRGKKKKDWVLTVPSLHAWCRCSLIHVPNGYDIQDGILVKKS